LNGEKFFSKLKKLLPSGARQPLALRPQLRWSGDTEKVKRIDYVLGPPEWQKVARRLGLFERLNRPVDEPTNNDPSEEENY